MAQAKQQYKPMHPIMRSMQKRDAKKMLERSKPSPEVRQEDLDSEKPDYGVLAKQILGAMGYPVGNVSTEMAKGLVAGMFAPIDIAEGVSQGVLTPSASYKAATMRPRGGGIPETPPPVVNPEYKGTYPWAAEKIGLDPESVPGMIGSFGSPSPTAKAQAAVLLSKLGASKLASLGVGAAMFGGLKKTGGKLKAYGGETAEVRESLIKAFEEADPAVQGMQKYFTKEEIELMQPQTIGKITDLLEARAGTATSVGDPRILPGGSRLDAKKIAAMASAGVAKKGWYEDTSVAIRTVFEDDTEQFSALLASTSPQISVEGNLENALNIWAGWIKAGRPTNRNEIIRIMGDGVSKTPLENRGAVALEKLSKDLDLPIGSEDEMIATIRTFQEASPQNAELVRRKSVMDAWIPNSVRSLSGRKGDSIRLSGAKVNSFRQNILGDTTEITQDTWEGKAVGVVQRVFGGARRKFTLERTKPSIAGDKKYTVTDELGYKSPGYIASSALHREAAEILTKSKAVSGKWTGAEVQETAWSFVKAVMEQRGAAGELRTIPEIMKDTKNLQKSIANVPDFAILLSSGRYSEILKGAGYGKQINKLATIPKVVPQGPAGSQGTYGGGTLGAIGDELEELYRSTTVPKYYTGIRNKIRPDEGGSDPKRFFARGSRGLAANELSTFKIPEKKLAELRSYGINFPEKVSQLKPNKISSKRFANAINKAKESHKELGASVFAYSPEEYQQMKLFITPDNKAGFAIKADGDIVSVFNHKKSKYRGISPTMMLLAVQEGGKKLDAFDVALPRFYSQAGFKISSRLPWSDAEAPVGWSKKAANAFNKGEPDVVFMHYDPDVNTTEVLLFGPEKYDPTDKLRQSQMAVDYGDALNRQFKAMNIRTDAQKVQAKSDAQSILNQPKPTMGKFYHGSEKEIKGSLKSNTTPDDLGIEGVTITPDADEAKLYGKVNEVYAEDLNLIDANELFEMKIWQDELPGEEVVKELRKLGYDGIDYSTLPEMWGGGHGIRVFNLDKLKLAN